MEWISVKDKLPEDDEYVLVYHSWDDYITSGYFDDHGWETDIPWAPEGKVTHWMYLPKAPKE